MQYNDSQYRTREWFESLKWQRPWIEKMAGWWVGEYGRPRTVVDFGAGDGWWCKSFHDMGATTYAVELDEIAKEYIPDQVYKIIHDIRTPVYMEGRSDLVICLEVVEHIPKLDAENVLLPTLTRATGNHLLMSAAQPGQQGTGHINLQTFDYWIRKIEGHGTLQFSGRMTQKAKQAFGNIVNEQFQFLPRNLMVFARVK